MKTSIEAKQQYNFVAQLVHVLNSTGDRVNAEVGIGVVVKCTFLYPSHFLFFCSSCSINLVGSSLCDFTPAQYFS